MWCLTNVCKYLKERYTDRARLFSAVPSDGTRANGLTHRRLPVNIRECFCAPRASKHWHCTACPVRWQSLHWRYSKDIQTQSRATCCSWPCLSKGTLEHSRSPCQPSPAHDQGSKKARKSYNKSCY